jgi:hypothetical protein
VPPKYRQRHFRASYCKFARNNDSLRGDFDGFIEKAVRASTTCLIMADHNRYNVDARDTKLYGMRASFDEVAGKGLARREVRELATGTFLDAKRNAIFIGGTGTGNAAGLRNLHSAYQALTGTERQP